MRIVGKYHIASNSPLIFVRSRQYNKLWSEDRLEMPDIAHIPQHLRVFIITYLKTGRPDVSFVAAYPEHGDKPRHWSTDRGREILAKPDVDKVIWEQMKKNGISINKVAVAMNQIININMDEANMKHVAPLKIKAAELILKMAGRKTLQNQSDGLDEGVLEGLEGDMAEAAGLKAKRKYTIGRQD